MITCEVKLPNVAFPMVISFVYASNEMALKYALWDEIVSLSTNQSLIGKPWSILGDFNQTLNPRDHSNSDGFSVDRATRDFRDCLFNASLQDLTFRGCSFTWWNKQKVAPIAKKLDRVLVNDSWLSHFPCSSAYFGEPDFSDHASSTINLSSLNSVQKKPFKFFNFHLQNSEFLNLICCSWFTFNFVGSDMFRLSKKLQALKKVIKDFSRLNFSDLEKELRRRMSC